VQDKRWQRFKRAAHGPALSDPGLPMSELLMHELPVTDHLKFSGPLTVRVAKQIRARVIDALRQFPHLTIDCSGASEVDLSFIQLMLAARRSASAASKTISFAQSADGALLEALQQAGLVAAADRQPVADQTFWFS
jgi:ABC-type transporter Mla MlaB component